MAVDTKTDLVFYIKVTEHLGFFLPVVRCLDHHQRKLLLSGDLNFFNLLRPGQAFKLLSNNGRSFIPVKEGALLSVRNDRNEIVVDI